MMKRKYLALISDQHVTEPGTTLYGLETNKSTARLSTFLQKEPLVEAIVSLGDLADTTLNPNRTEATASSAAYENARELLSNLNTPFLTIAGNHDDPSILEKYFPNQWQQKTAGVSLYHFHGIDLVALDVRTGPEATAYITQDTLGALDEVLSSAQRAIILSHFPLFELDNTRIVSGLSLTNQKELLPILKHHTATIAGCYSGHLHFWFSTTCEGISATGVPSSSFGFKLEPMSQEQESVSAEPCGYLLLGIGEDGSVITRPRFLPPATRVE